MTDDAQTREQLAAELAELRARCDRLEAEAAQWRAEEKRLRLSYELFHKAFRRARDPILICTAPDGRCIEANEAFVRSSGYDREEIIGQRAEELNIWPDPGERDRFFRELSDKGFVREQVAGFQNKAGRPGVVCWHAELVTVGDGQYIVALAEDITEQKRAEEALKQSEERYRFLAENMADIVWTMDLGFKTIFVSPSVEKVLGFTPEERKRQTLEEMLTPESMQRTLEVLSRELQHEQDGADPERPVIVEVEYYRRDGSTLWVENSLKALRDKDGVLIGMYGSSRDISLRKAAEADREHLIGELQEALVNIKTLRGLIPICSNCKKIRDDQGYWQQVEVYVREHSDAQFSHSICPECMDKLYPGRPGTD
jgi:PAS domain S-box-containing protein